MNEGDMVFSFLKERAFLIQLPPQGLQQLFVLRHGQCGSILCFGEGREG